MNTRSPSATVERLTEGATGRDQETVELPPAPVRIGPPGDVRDESWTATGPQLPVAPVDREASPWDETALRAALRRVPSVDDVEGVRSRARSGLFGTEGEPVRLGRLELIARIGAGGMGEVYTARDVELDRQVAVKLVRADADSRDATARIMREAQMMARVTHPNVVRIYDVGRIESRVYITMEYVQGTTLRDWVEAAPRSWREILEHYVRAGRGLAAAHRTGLVHRDFKPSNVLVGDDDRVLVADFGLARSISSDGETNPASSEMVRLSSPGMSMSAQPVTAQGAVLGTPGYMSPEQLQAAPVDGRSDLFSFCVALYEALHGVRPYTGRTVQSLLASIQAGEISPPLHTVRLPTRVARAIARGLHAEPGRRFAAMDELLGELERALRGPGRAVGASVVVAAGLIAGAAMAQVGPFAAADPCAGAGTELAEVWNGEREQALRSRFTASGLDFAEVVAERASTRLDAYAAEWGRARVDACEAAQVRHDQSAQLFDMRMACLERRRGAVRALVETLVAADRTTVEKAVDSVAMLPAIEPCNDAESLARGLRAPDSQEVALAVAGVREDIARGEALYATGHYREGLTLATRAVTAAGAVDYEPLRAEALGLRGRLLTQVGDIVGAEATLLEAVELAEANRHDELAADLWLGLVRLANGRLVDPLRGAAWMQRTRAAQRRIGNPRARRIVVLGEQAALHFHERQYEAAERVFRTALALHEAVGGDAQGRRQLLNGLALTLEASGEYAEARSSYIEALAATEAALGGEHPEYARVLFNYAALLTLLGELDEAEPRLRSALAIFTRALGAADHFVGRVHIALVEHSLRRGAFDEAIAHAATAVRIYREVLPGDHQDLVDAEVALGTARFFGGELEAALDAFLAARELQRRVSPVDPLLMAVTAVDIAETQVALRRFAEARVSFGEVERLLGQLTVRDLDLEARVLTGRGQIALAEGEARRALPLLEAAVDLRRQLPDDPLAQATLQEALIRARRG